MPFAVQLDLDAVGASEIDYLSYRLERIPDLETVLQIGDAHHISLAVYEDLPAERFVADLARFAAVLEPLVVQLANIGIFTGARSVVFLGPVPTEELLALHRRFHDEFSAFAGSCWGHYRRGYWVPHVTLGMNAGSAALQRAAVEIMKSWKPTRARLDVVRLVRFRPVETIYRFALSSR